MKNNLIQKRKNISKLTIIISIVSIMFYYLMDAQWLINTNFTLHEIMALAYSFFLFLIPIMIVMWIYYLIHTLSELKFSRMSIRNILINIATTMIVILTIGFQITRFYVVSTSGIYDIESKWRDGEQYYIVIDEKNIKCTRNEHNLIQEDDRYLITFEWNKLRSTLGQLETIKPIESRGTEHSHQ